MYQEKLQTMRQSTIAHLGDPNEVQVHCGSSESLPNGGRSLCVSTSLYL